LVDFFANTSGHPVRVLTDIDDVLSTGFSVSDFQTVLTERVGLNQTDIIAVAILFCSLMVGAISALVMFYRSRRCELGVNVMITFWAIFSIFVQKGGLTKKQNNFIIQFFIDYVGSIIFGKTAFFCVDVFGETWQKSAPC
jgi:hypothetical protein